MSAPASFPPNPNPISMEPVPPPPAPVAIYNCPQCSHYIAEGTLVCPECGTLIYTQHVATLAHAAQSLEQEKRWPEARATWADALPGRPARNRHSRSPTGHHRPRSDRARRHRTTTRIRTRLNRNEVRKITPPDVRRIQPPLTGGRRRQRGHPGRIGGGRVGGGRFWKCSESDHLMRLGGLRMPARSGCCHSRKPPAPAVPSSMTGDSSATRYARGSPCQGLTCPELSATAEPPP